MTGENEGLAQKLLDGIEAEARIEDRLCLRISSYVEHIGGNHFDQSLDVYFHEATPQDFEITERQAEAIWEMGFRSAQAHYADGTVQSLTRGRTSPREPTAQSCWRPNPATPGRLGIGRFLAIRHGAEHPQTSCSHRFHG